MIQHATELDLLRDIAQWIKPRDPIDETIQISSTKPWIVNYHERKHIFIWFPVAQTLSAEDYGSGTVQAQVWINLGFKPGVALTVSSATLVPMMIRFSDEVIP